MVRLCIALHMTPEEYRRLTAEEHRAFVNELTEQAKAQERVAKRR
jgi:hypothetical protein